MQSKEEGKKENSKNKTNQGRREVIKTLATVPIVGALVYGAYKKAEYDRNKKQIGDIFQLSPDSNSKAYEISGTDTIRIGIIGFGTRGKMLVHSSGFALPEKLQEWIDAAKKNKQDTRYSEYVEQESLNIRITAVCDIFDTYAENSIKAARNLHKEGVDGKKFIEAPKRYKNYKELLAAPDVDAVIIATPDHWHGTMALEAAKRGKHVYLEKPFTWTLPETIAVRNAVKESGIIFQLGHQNRHIESYNRAKEIIEKGYLGKVNLIETSTNRNSKNAAWVYDIHPDASEKTIDWKQFIPEPERWNEYISYMKGHNLERYIGPEDIAKFSKERFFRWRCWWDYSSGLAGDLLTHEYDAVNQILGMGIPHSATASGGIYYFKDGRTVPDVLQTSLEFPEKDLTMLYTATQGNSYKRNKLFMGTEGTLEINKTLSVYADRNSELYKEKIDQGIIKPDVPFYTYIPGSDKVDAVTSPTELYFAQRGLLYTYINGKRYDTTYLHIREWLNGIRNNKQPSCNIDAAFEEAITAQMASRAYLEGKTVYWDKDKEDIL